MFSIDSWLDNLHGPSILNIFENLARLGYQVKVLLPSTSNKLVRSGSFSVVGLKVKRPTLFSASLWKCSLEFLFENRPSMLLFDYWMLPLFMLAKLLYKSEGIFLILSRPVGQKGFKAWRSFLHFRLSLMLSKSFVNRVTAISPFEAVEFSRMAKISKEKMMILPSPLGEHFKKNSLIDEDQLRLKLGLDVLLRKKVLLYHGVLHEQRGILEVLEVFANSFKGDNEIALLLVGDGPAKSSVKNFIQKNKIKNIVFKGAVPYSNMPEIIEASDIGLVLLPNHHQWRYQSPTKLIELLAMDKPVIASDLPGIRWTAGNSPSVVYLKTLSVSAFKEAVKKALTKRDIKVRQEMIDRFSSYSIALRLSQVVSICCDRNDC